MAERSPIYKLIRVYRGDQPTGWMRRVAGVPRWIVSHKKAPTGKAADDHFRRHEKKFTSEGPVEVEGPSDTARELVNRWLNERRADMEADGITPGHYDRCAFVARWWLKHVGPETAIDALTPDHFSAFGRKLQKRFKGEALRVRVRILLAFVNHANEEDWTERPIKVGKRFRSLARLESEPRRRKLPSPEQFRGILKAICDYRDALKLRRERDVSSIEQLYAMVLLAANGGFGQKDLAEMPRDVVDLERAMIDYRRGKTFKERLVPLWPETVDALRLVLAKRVGDPLVFRTREGNLWVREVRKSGKKGEPKVMPLDNVNQAYTKILKRLGQKVKGEGFYTIRSLHRTHSDNAADQHVSDILMGHAFAGSRKAYIQLAETPGGVLRMWRVVMAIREHLLGLPPGPASASSASAPAKA